MKTQFHLLNYLKFNRVLKCAPELDKLLKEKDIKKRIKLLNDVNDCVIDAISEIAKNCLLGNIPLSEEDFKNLSKYQYILRKISKPIPIERRRKLIQKGAGFIDILNPLTLMLITFIIKSLFDNE